MQTTQELIQKVEHFGAHNYKPLSVVLSRGKGATVWDIDGKEYIDFLSCYSALNFGHQHPRLVAAMKEQLDLLANCSRAFHNEKLCQFSEDLAHFCGFETVLTMNSGAEAVESAIKIARKWGYQKKNIAPGKAKIIAMENNFHGRTVTIISFSTEDLYRDGFGPFTPGFEVVPFGDAEKLEQAIDANTVAVLLEPIQAEAGILIPPSGFLSKVRQLCSKNNVLMMLDEIQTGFGRTGKDFAYEHEGVRPDVLILGKSLGGGLIPLSAVVTRREVMDVLRPGAHGSTFGGNPLACAVGIEVLKVLDEERLSDRSFQLGRKIMSTLEQATLPHVKELRGRGALIGIELNRSTGGARKYCERLADQGVLCKETHDYVIRIAPPLISSDAEIERGLATLIDVVRSFA